MNKLKNSNTFSFDRMKLKKFTFFLFIFIMILFFTNCMKNAEDIDVHYYGKIINKLNDTIIFRAEFLYTSGISIRTDTLYPNSYLSVSKCCDGVGFIEIYKKNDPNNLFIKFHKFDAPHVYNYKLDPYDCNNWVTTSRYYKASRFANEVTSFLIIEESEFYITNENVINR